MGLVAVALLVTRVADGVAAKGSETCTDGGSFETTTALITDDATDSSSPESSDDGALLSGWPSGTRGKGECGDGEDGCECCFHSAFG